MAWYRRKSCFWFFLATNIFVTFFILNYQQLTPAVHSHRREPGVDNREQVVPVSNIMKRAAGHKLHVVPPQWLRQDTEANYNQTFDKPGSNQKPFPGQSKCPDLDPPQLVGYFDHWQNVSHGDEHFIFSAYKDGGELRLIGVSRYIADRSLYCQMWHREAFSGEAGDKGKTEKISLHIAAARLVQIPEHHNHKYRASFFKCSLPTGVVPFAVSLVTSDGCQQPLNVMKVALPAAKKYEFSVCVKAMHTNYDNVYQLVEFIELNRILGADSFTFYDFSIGPNVQKVLDWYRSKELVDLVSWKVPVKHYNIQCVGLLASLNDCLYRTGPLSKYLVFVDFDEFIIPRNPETKTWSDMMSGLPEKGAYIFRNTFFKKDWPDSYEGSYGGDIVKTYQLVTLSKLHRENTIHTAGIRSKLIVNPSAIDTVGNHNVWAFRPSWTAYTVDVTVGLNHHYRYVEGQSKKLQDLTMLKFSDSLIRNVNDTWQMLESALMIEMP